MSRRAGVGILAKTSYWLAQTLGNVVRLHAGPAAIEPAVREQVERINHARISDAEDRLALALEAFGEVIRNGDCALAEKIVAELEVPNGAARRSYGRRDYRDLIRKREGDRAFRRELEQLRGRLQQMKGAKVPGRELRPVRDEIRVLEEILGEPFSGEGLPRGGVATDATSVRSGRAAGRGRPGRPRSADAG